MQRKRNLSRLLLIGAIGAAALMAGGSAAAQQAWGVHGLGDGGVLRTVAHRHHHKSGHALLGERLHHDGHHELEKLKGRSVSVEVRHGKVVGMAAEDLKVKRVKSSHKMASLDGGLLRAAYDGPLQLAQYDTSYYGYCFDDGVDYTCYWYPADDIDDTSGVWEPYDPTY